ncbi:protein adenylyltransferase SelO [Hydrogenophaga sp. 5NK40-0174]|uniref:protein adenylyltransferase SelO n=1 Tax=Hydrogenophaga sp. 5NK40-0174 TaxID=3127649 RepID=UPI003102F78A
MSTANTTPLFPFDNQFARDMQGMFAPWEPAKVPAPRWLRFNHALAESMGLEADRLGSDEGLQVLAGNVVPEGATPLAQAYAGHQFGGFSPQLGDGRALLLGEVVTPEGKRLDIAFKGSGRTPFSRGGDGKAAVGPVLREYLISEAMYALGIPTTRTLAAVATGETIARDRPLPGAILTRVASSHVRVGTFQFFAARGDIDSLRKLVNFVVNRHYPALADAEGPERALGLLRAVQTRQAKLIAQWMGVAFIHGVMNTDNMTLSGETIDYGPCAFMEAYDPQTVFSSIDHGGRYAYGNQPGIAQWNLTRLAETLLPLIDAEDSDKAVALATEVIEAFPAEFDGHWLNVHRRKLGIPATQEDGPPGQDTEAEQDRNLVNDYLQLLHRHGVDFTLGFRRLSRVLRGQSSEWSSQFAAQAEPDLQAWSQRWLSRLPSDGTVARSEHADAMDAVNPLYIPRNHLVENALDAASDPGDMALFERLLAIVTRPFDEREADALAALAGTPEQTQGFRTFCGT